LRIIKDHVLAPNEWTRLEEGTPPVSGNIVVSFRRWQAQPEVFEAHKGRLGVWIDGDDDLAALAPHLERFALIAIEFPMFKDGRGYSQARLLREKYAYHGELRAIGDVLRDQLFYMRRCGFDSFEVRADTDLEAALKGFEDFSVKYQPAADGVPPIYHLR